MKSKIIEIAKSINLTEIGFTSAENAGADCEKYKTAVVFLFPYYKDGEVGRISLYARGRDYHGVIREKLGIIARYMIENGAEKADIFGDTGGLDDRNAAVCAGLGFFGKNRMVISDKYGSYFFIGIILTDIELDCDMADERKCMGCGRCEKLCTGGAISEDGFDINKCVSHISQKKGELNNEEKERILKSGMCWGCDVCQTVCPHNLNVSENLLEEFKKDRICDLEISELENMSNREFMRRYKDYAFSWRGIKPILRNLKILDDKEFEL